MRRKSPEQRVCPEMRIGSGGRIRTRERTMHSPLEEGINGVVSNMPEFQKAFPCKPGQQMVRAQACCVW